MNAHTESVRLSIALVTRNRPQELDRCLNSWRRQSAQPGEIVVSDDSDDDFRGEVFAVVKKYSAIYQAGSRQGLYANRNAAALACSGTHIMSADDDHTHPEEFVSKILQTVRSDPARIWTFGEKNPATPEQPIARPGELHVSGCGCAPANYEASAAISDGASVYPRAVFGSGLRYDESYSFGGMWYLWGKVLQCRGWRITYSDATFVWHHFNPVERAEDRMSLTRQLCCNTYATLVNSRYVERSGTKFALALLYLIRRMVFTDSAPGYAVKARITPGAACELLLKVREARALYAGAAAS